MVIVYTFNELNFSILTPSTASIAYSGYISSLSAFINALAIIVAPYFLVSTDMFFIFLFSYNLKFSKKSNIQCIYYKF
jgi:hypothetical protein